MTDQEKIAALADELTRLNRLPRPWMGCFDPDALADDDDRIMALSALSGVAAAEVLPEHGYMIVRSGKTDSGESDEEGNIIWADWCWELYKHNWGNGDDYLGEFDTYHEALVAALKQVESEVKS